MERYTVQVCASRGSAERGRLSTWFQGHVTDRTTSPSTSPPGFVTSCLAQPIRLEGAGKWGKRRPISPHHCATSHTPHLRALGLPPAHPTPQGRRGLHLPTLGLSPGGLGRLLQGGGPSLGGLAKVGPGRGLHQPQAPPSPRIDSGAGSLFLLRVLRSSPALPTPPLCPRRYRCSCRCDRCSPPSSSPAGLPACAAPPRRASHPAWELPPTRPGAGACRLRFGSDPADGCGRSFM